MNKQNIFMLTAQICKLHKFLETFILRDVESWAVRINYLRKDTHFGSWFCFSCRPFFVIARVFESWSCSQLSSVLAFTASDSFARSLCIYYGNAYQWLKEKNVCIARRINKTRRNLSRIHSSILRLTQSSLRAESLVLFVPINKGIKIYTSAAIK